MRILFTLCGLLCSLTYFGTIAGADATPPQFTITDLGAKPNAMVKVTGLNNKGAVVGAYLNKRHGYSACLWVDDHRTDLSRQVLDLFATYSDLDSEVNAINDKGQVAGSAGQRGVGALGFMFGRGKAVDISCPYIGGPHPTALNNSGEVVGIVNVNTPSGYSNGRAFVYTKNHMMLLGIPSDKPRDYDGAFSINDQQQIVGYRGNIRIDLDFLVMSFLGADNTDQAILWENGKEINLGTLPGDQCSTAVSVNNQGQVVGASWKLDAGPIISGKREHPYSYSVHAFLWQRGKMTDLGTLKRSSEQLTFARSINNKGQVVGYSNNRAFLWQHGKMYDLNYLIPAENRRLPSDDTFQPPNHSKWSLGEAIAINDRGQIIGKGYNGEGSWGYFMLTPKQ